MSSRAWLLIAIICCGAAFRVCGLGRESVWGDEAFAVQTSQRSVGDIVNATAGDVHPPLYYLSLHYWMVVAGSSEASIRLLSALASVATLIATFFVARPLLGETAACMAAALIAISPIQIGFAQEARMYALLALLSTLSMWAYARFVTHPTRVAVALYVLASGALVYVHVYGFWILAAQATTMVWLLLARRPHVRTLAVVWIGAVAIVALIWLPWSPIFLTQLDRVQEGFWIAQPSSSALVDVLEAYAGAAWLGFAWAALACAGAVALARATSTGAPSLVVLLPWLAGPVLLPLVLSLVGSSIFLPKYTIAASIPFAMLAAAGLSAIPGRLLRLGVLALMMGGMAAQLPHFTGARQKDDWRSAVASLEREARTGDLVLFYKYFNQIPFDFYRVRADLVTQPFSPDIYLQAPDPAVLRYFLVHSVEGRSRVWLVLLRGEPLRRAILATFSPDFQTVTDRFVQNVELVLFEARPSTGPS